MLDFWPMAILLCLRNRMQGLHLLRLRMNGNPAGSTAQIRTSPKLCARHALQNLPSLALMRSRRLGPQRRITHPERKHERR
jgi:hypothetical protein